MTTRFPLADVRLELGAQVREAIDATLVTAYGERMLLGDTFPPITLFHDGAQYFLADGFHRCLAARQIGAVTIAADLCEGTRAEAWWFAIGANRSNGQRLTPGDVRHAIELACRLWPMRTGLEIANQIGCSQGYVSKIRRDGIPTNITVPQVVRSDGRAIPAIHPPRVTPVHPQHDEIVARLRAGQPTKQIREELHARPERIAEVRRELGLGPQPDQSRAAVQARRARIRTMAAEGYTTRQIAAAVQIGREAVRDIAKREAIDIAADRVVGQTRRHDPNRIVGRIVMDAENLTAGVELVEFTALDATQLPEWIRSLLRSRAQLSTFIRQLQEYAHHEQAAQPSPVQDSPGPDRADAHPPRVGDAA